MTREEAIGKINAIKKYLTAGNPIWDVREIDEALNMAIDALQANTSKAVNAALVNKLEAKYHIPKREPEAPEEPGRSVDDIMQRLNTISKFIDYFGTDAEKKSGTGGGS